MESKRTKKMEEEEEDRISALQDCLIQHIISFLPSTKQAIQTSILSKRWRNQWTHVPVLIFKSTGTSSEKFLKLVENALVLHDCYKIKKFHLDYFYLEKADQFTSKIRYATRKHVEDLNLSSGGHRYMLPEFLFNCASLVKLTTHHCHFMPHGKVNWGCLTQLNVNFCNLTDQALECILSGTPLLTSLQVTNCEYPSDNLVIASESMKILVLQELVIMEIQFFEISCPNLEELSLRDITIEDPKVFRQAIEHVLFGCSFLKSFSLVDSRDVEHLVFASKSLKRLTLGQLNFILNIEISCPMLEVLDISDCFNIETVKLLDLPALVYASIEFYHDGEPERSTQEHGSLIKDTLQQLHHVKELSLGNWFMKILSATEVGGLFSPVLNTRRLTLNYVDLNERHSGIACVLRNSPMLEELVIRLPFYGQLHDDLPELNDFGENCWKSDMHAYGCLVSHLKTIRIIGYPKRDDKRKFVLNFVQFLLKNARVLEKMVLEWEEHETAFSFKLFQELLSLPRCSQYAIIELLCSK